MAAPQGNNAVGMSQLRMPDPKQLSTQPRISGHFVASSHTANPAGITVAPVGSLTVDGNVPYDAPLPVRDQNGYSEHETYVPVVTGENRVPYHYPKDPIPFNDRVPLNCEAQGYINVAPHSEQSWKDALGQAYGFEHSENGEEVLLAEHEVASPMGDFLSVEAFASIADGFKSGDGKFLAMTAYGAVPLPDQLLKTIPEKFVSEPIRQDREVFVMKQNHCVRVVERDYIQFDHKFKSVSHNVAVDRFKTIDDVKIIEIPRFNYTPIIEDKLVEVPHGIKYVEVPIEVPCKMPPKIVPVPKPHIVERIIETTKPVVQEKIIEVPEVIKKKVPRVVTKEIPYVVPKYVEKIVEVPYKPGQELPAPQGAPMTLIPKPPPLPSDGSLPVTPSIVQGRVERDTFLVENVAASGPQTFYLSQDIKNIQLPYEARLDISLVPQSDIPAGMPIAQQGVRYVPPSVQGPEQNVGILGNFMHPKTQDPNQIQPVYAGAMDPIIEHAAPGMRAIQFRTRSEEPDILTQHGVVKYSKFECCLNRNTDRLIGNLPHHDLVPMYPDGVPNVKDLSFIHSEHAARQSNYSPSA